MPKLTIETYRAMHRLSQLQLANAINRTPQTICNWENGKSSPTVEDLRSMANIFGCEWTDFLLPECVAKS